MLMKDKKLNLIYVEKEEEDLYTDTYEEVTTLPNKTSLTVMGEHLYGSFIHVGIDVPQFHYDRVHTVGPKFD